jgi:hypothetical protein
VGIVVTLALAMSQRAARAQNQDDFEDVEVEPGAVVMPMNFANVNNAPNAEQFDQWVFNRAGGAGATRNRQNTVLALHIDELSRTCGISEAQMKKLQLAGHGDIKRFFDRVDEAKRRYLATRNGQNNNVWAEINPLQAELNVGLFGDDSIFAKTIKTTLNEEQSARYAEAQQLRRLSRYRTTVAWWVIQVDKSLGLGNDQRRRLAALLEQEGRPPRRFGQGDYWYMMLQAALIPEAKLKPIFDAVQWRLLGNQLNQARGMEQWLRQNGMMPDDRTHAAGKAVAALPAAVLVPAVEAEVKVIRKNAVQPAEKKAGLPERPK